MDQDTTKIASFLATNIDKLRNIKGLTQARLAQLAGIPRTTLTNLESGLGNPSLSNLIKISTALGVGIEELLSRPRPSSRLMRVHEIPIQKRSNGRVELHKLMPDQIKGIEIDRLVMTPESTMTGHPHLEGTKEYLTVIEGKIVVNVAGEAVTVSEGEVFAFQGNQPHSYRNLRKSNSVAISVVIPVPLFT